MICQNTGVDTKQIKIASPFTSLSERGETFLPPIKHIMMGLLGVEVFRYFRTACNIFSLLFSKIIPILDLIRQDNERLKAALSMFDTNFMNK